MDTVDILRQDASGWGRFITRIEVAVSVFVEVITDKSVTAKWNKVAGQSRGTQAQYVLEQNHESIDVDVKIRANGLTMDER